MRDTLWLLNMFNLLSTLGRACRVYPLAQLSGRSIINDSWFRVVRHGRVLLSKDLGLWRLWWAAILEPEARSSHCCRNEVWNACSILHTTTHNDPKCGLCIAGSEPSLQFHWMLRSSSWNLEALVTLAFATWPLTTTGRARHRNIANMTI